jgi:hypothetical protein
MSDAEADVRVRGAMAAAAFEDCRPSAVMSLAVARALRTNPNGAVLQILEAFAKNDLQLRRHAVAIAFQLNASKFNDDAALIFGHVYCAMNQYPYEVFPKVKP